MRFAYLPPLFLSCLSVCWAQSPAQATTAAEFSKTSASSTTGAVEKRVEVIQVEDAGARIDELRVGGETKTITVQPKARMPAYEVQPVTGARSWKILGF